MRIRVLSDLHFEFWPDGAWQEAIAAMSVDCDVLVLVGDICGFDQLEEVLRLFSQRFLEIVFVPGNHEFYRSSPSETMVRISRVATWTKNLHWLNRNVVELGGHRFLGTTLWFERPPEIKYGERYALNDFFAIREFEPWVYQENALSRVWLAQHMGEGDVVVTHHLPSHRSVHPKYASSALNRFFLGTTTLELDDLMAERNPALWLHGHTHESFDYRAGKTRVVCNPLGYYGHEMNANFDFNKTVEV